MTPFTREDLKDIQELARSVAIASHAADVDDKARFPIEGYRALVESQLHALVIPEDYGGVGADAIAAAVAGEEIARVCATTNQVAGANELFAWPLLLAGSEEQKQRWLAPIAAGEALGAFALSEPEAGSDIASMTSRAVSVGDGWRVRGTKRWITNGGVADCHCCSRSPIPTRAPAASPRSSSRRTTPGSPSARPSGRWVSRAHPPPTSTSTTSS